MTELRKVEYAGVTLDVPAGGGGGGTAGVTTFNGRDGAVVPQAGDYNKTLVGLGNVDNTSDADKPVSTATQAALNLKANVAETNAALAAKANTADLAAVATSGSYDDLTNKPTIPPAYTLPTASASELGGIKIGTGLVIDQDGVVSASGTAGVETFNGRTGTVTPQDGDYTAAMVGLGNVDNTSDADKPISTATQAALDLKANTADLATVATTGDYADLTNAPAAYTLPTASAAELGGVKVGSGLAISAEGVLSATGGGGGGGVAGVETFNGRDGVVTPQAGDYTAEMVGLGNVNNTSDADKPISTATQAALDLKANTADLATVATTGSYNDLTDQPTPYTLPAATDSELGGVKVGSGLSVAADGTLSATGTGGASSLDDLSDVGLSTSPPAGALLGFDGTEWKDVELTGGGATSVTQTANGLQVYSSPYNLPNASDTVLGGVKVGAGLQIDGSGVLSATGGGGTGGMTEFEALTGVKNVLQIGDGYRGITTNNDGSITVPAPGSGGATYILTEDFRPSKYGLKSGDKLYITGLIAHSNLKISSYSAQNVVSTVSGDPGVWTISDAVITDDRAVIKLETDGLFAGGNLKLMARLDGVANSEFQPFALNNAGLTTSVACIADTLGCKNLIPPYSQPSGNTFTVNADTGGIAVASTGGVGDRFVLAQGLIDSGVVKAGQKYLLSGIGTKDGSAAAIASPNASLTFEYELGGATQTVTAAHYTDTLVDIPAGATGGNVVLTKLSGGYAVNPVYPMLRDARMADAQYQKPAAFPYSSLASLSDTNIPANPAANSLLMLQNGKWTPNTVEGAIGGKPAIANGTTQNVTFGYDAYSGPQYWTVDASGSTHVVNLFEANGIVYYKKQAGSTDFQKEGIIAPPAYSYLTGLDTSQVGRVTASDTVLSAMGKLSGAASGMLQGTYMDYMYTRIGAIGFLCGIYVVKQPIAAGQNIEPVVLPVGTRPISITSAAITTNAGIFIGNIIVNSDGSITVCANSEIQANSILAFSIAFPCA